MMGQVRTLASLFTSLHKPQYRIPPQAQAHVLFSRSDKPFAKFFKKDFRHCAVLLPISTGFILVDPNSTGLHLTEIKEVALADIYDLAGKNDVRLLTTGINTNLTRIKIPLCFTCVGIVKRILGIRAWHVITPYQLYKHLKKG